MSATMAAILIAAIFVIGVAAAVVSGLHAVRPRPPGEKPDQ